MWTTESIRLDTRYSFRFFEKSHYICKSATECSFTSTGYDYQGSLAKTDSGNCYSWAGQTALTNMEFPDKSLLDAGSQCRNPDSRAQPWCYTGRSYDQVGYCNSIPQCRKLIDHITIFTKFFILITYYSYWHR